MRKFLVSAFSQKAEREHEARSLVSTCGRCASSKQLPASGAMLSGRSAFVEFKNVIPP